MNDKCFLENFIALRFNFYKETEGRHEINFKKEYLSLLNLRCDCYSRDAKYDSFFTLITRVNYHKIIVSFYDSGFRGTLADERLIRKLLKDKEYEKMYIQFNPNMGSKTFCPYIYLTLKS